MSAKSKQSKRRDKHDVRAARKLLDAQSAVSDAAMAEARKAVAVSGQLLNTLQWVLEQVAIVVGQHAGQPYTWRGVKQQRCLVCKVVAPCSVYSALQPLGLQTEGRLSDSLHTILDVPMPDEPDKEGV